MKIKKEVKRTGSDVRVLGPGGFFGDVLHKEQVCGLVLSVLKHDRAKKLPKHMHQLAFFNLLLDGDYVEYFSRESAPLKPFTTIFHPAGVEHRDEIGPKGLRIFSIELQEHWLERIREHGGLPDSSMDLRGGEMTCLATRLYREYLERDSCSSLAIEGLVLEMLALVARTKDIYERRPPLWLKQLIERLHENFLDDLTVQGLALELGIHPIYLSRTFRQFHHLTIGTYLRRLRVHFAMNQLLNSHLEIASVAETAGFADQSHFTRLFKELTGMTPATFRQVSTTVRR